MWGGVCVVVEWWGVVKCSGVWWKEGIIRSVSEVH